ncbi:MAG: cytochrome C [Deltaproteobacteria bacterium]|nr:cytochrome C [Deltaproteobacteria bacterium]
MKRIGVLGLIVLIFGTCLAIVPEGKGQPVVDNRICIDCHSKTNPGIVSSWNQSRMAWSGVTCIDCHGSDHKSGDDAFRISMLVGRVCERCHQEEARQFHEGKHAGAWTSVYALSDVEALPVELVEGEQGCGGCHAIGRWDGGCDSCHTRHTFSREEARQPTACLPCHGGINHPQYEIWQTSKHGVVFEVSKKGRGPTCQTCHMPRGNHGVRTAWSLLGLRASGTDSEWAESRRTILRWLGLIDAAGKPTAKLDGRKARGIVLLSYEKWKEQRDRMVETCARCHSRLFVLEKMGEVDSIIKKADRLMADAILLVQGLYQDGILPRPESAPPCCPDLLGFHRPPNPLEGKLVVMFLKYRLIMLHGAFHNNPDYTTNYGWVKLKEGYQEIAEAAGSLRAGQPANSD